MWLFLNDCFLSIVKKDCPEESLLVRARRPGDIEKVFGRRVKVTRAEDADYLYRAVVPCDEVRRAMVCEIARIEYGNFKDSVDDKKLHDAYLRVWTDMAALQEPRPYSKPKAIKWHSTAIKEGTAGSNTAKEKEGRQQMMIDGEYVDLSGEVLSVDRWNAADYWAVFLNGKKVKLFWGEDAECRAHGYALAMLDHRELR